MHEGELSAVCGHTAEDLLHRLDDGLHDLSQPLTVLLCTLEHGAGVDSIEEMRSMITVALEACHRLRDTMHGMQQQVREALEHTHREDEAAKQIEAGRNTAKQV